MAATDDESDVDLHERVNELSGAIGRLAFTELIQEARSGSDEARGEVMRSLQTYLLMIANEELDAVLRAKVGASDLVQSALHQVQRHLDAFKGNSHESLLAWVRKILKNEIAEARRSYFDTEKRDVRREVRGDDSQFAVPIVDSNPLPPAAAAIEEDANRLRIALEDLSDDHRTVILLRNWERLPFDEIGVRMSRSADAVKKLWTRALQQLREKLEGTA